MKKIFAILLAVILVCSLSATAFADNFVNSAANAGAPEVETVVDKDGKDVASVIGVTPITEKEELAEEEQKVLDEAFESLKEAENLAEVNDSLKEAAGDKDIAVSDLFNISAKEEVSFPLTLTLKNENLDNFVALLQYVDGEWNWVDAEVKDNQITFTVDQLGTFAIVVAAEPATSAQTGEPASIGLIAAAVVFAVAAGFFFTKSLKVKA